MQYQISYTIEDLQFIRNITSGTKKPEQIAELLRSRLKVDGLIFLSRDKSILIETGNIILGTKPNFFNTIIIKDFIHFTLDALQEEKLKRFTNDISDMNRLRIAYFPVIHEKMTCGYIYVESQKEQIGRKEFELIEKLIAHYTPFLLEQFPSFAKHSEFQHSFLGLKGVSAQMREIIRKIQIFSQFDESVLIEGASGTGKELAAHAIHRLSYRKLKQFSPINCSVFTESLAESTIMGHKKGSYTGAFQDKRGIFEVVEGGTLFLDEVGDLGIPLQAMLLRILQEKKIKRLGENKEKEVDFRLLCATNKNLTKMVQDGLFREDLFYRISTLKIEIPTLAERREDIIPIAEDKLRDFIRQYQFDIAPELFTESAKEKLKNHPWHGNIRELINVLRRSLIMLGDKRIIDENDVILEDLFSVSTGKKMIIPAMLEGDSLDEFIQKIVALEFKKSGYEKIKTAEKLQISLHYLNNILAKKSVFKANVRKKEEQIEEDAL
jgi:transcriptional regulator with PAS, ATPase and Fis domain